MPNYDTEVLGLYDTRADADSAAQALEQAGFSRSDIKVAAYGDDTATGTATVGQKAESGWQKFLEEIHLVAPKQDADYYSSGLRSGQTLVTVSTDDASAQQAASILNQYGALDIDDHSNKYYESQAVAGVVPSATTTAYVPDTAYTNTAGAANVSDGAVIPVIEEELQVGKRAVQGGGVRVYKRMTERPVSEQVTLHEERVTVDRRPVDRALTDTDLNNAFKEGTIELTETSEQAVVSKQARVVEEVVVGKTATDRVETISDTVRRTDVDVEEIDATDTAGTSRLR